MRSLLILSIAIGTALAMHFTPQGRHFTQTVITGLNQAQSTISDINTNGTNSTAAAQTPGAFKGCPQFFYQGTPPSVPNAEQWKPRALCFDAFAVYHSGKSKTPIFVAEKLNRAQLVDAQDEKRTNRFYADARLPSAERATLDDVNQRPIFSTHQRPKVSSLLARFLPFLALLEPERIVACFQNFTVMRYPIQQSRRHLGIPEYRYPLTK